MLYKTRLNKQEFKKNIILQAINKEISKIEAAFELGISDRQLRNIIRKYKELGDLAFIHGNCGALPKNKISSDKKEKTKQLLIEKYNDFGAKFACEKLLEDDIKLSKETIRKYQIELGINKKKRKKNKNLHQSRKRREKFGELIQIDGSHHAWFEDRAPKCCLIVFIDDATSKITSMCFENAETTNGYLGNLQEHILEFGIPFCLYSDKHSIFKVNILDPKTGDGRTEFQKSLDELGIKIIHANSPQAKGRVERANRTLQDRLVKELRLKNICTIEQGNNYLPEFIQEFNKKFALKIHEDCHKPSKYTHEELKLILSKKEERKLDKSLNFSLNGNVYQIKIEKGKIGLAMREQKIIIYHVLKENFKVFYKGKEMNYTMIKTNKYQSIKSITVCDKTINWTIDALQQDASHKMA